MPKDFEGRKPARIEAGGENPVNMGALPQCRGTNTVAAPEDDRPVREAFQDWAGWRALGGGASPPAGAVARELDTDCTDYQARQDQATGPAPNQTWRHRPCRRLPFSLGRAAPRIHGWAPFPFFLRLQFVSPCQKPT